MRTLNTLLAISLSLTLAAGQATAQGAAASSLTRIGAAAAVHGSVKATAPGATVGRVLESGKPVYLNDHVVTDAGGHLQVMLLDETVFTLGPNSDMVLDEFVYDPNTSTGKVTARVAKGVFRFVTGKVAAKSPSDMKVNLPIGTIGIRGTIVNGSVNGDTSQIVLGGPGQHPSAGEKPGAFDVTSGNQTQSVSKEGFGVTVGPGGVSNPAPMPDVSNAIAGQLAPPPHGSGNQTGQTVVPGNLNDASGSSTASGAAPASDSQTQSLTTDSLAKTLTQATQDASQLANDISTWDQIIANVPTGLSSYIASGAFTQTLCGGTPCSVAGSWNFQLDVDFAARTVNGFASAAAGTISDSVGFGTSYGALTGPAKFTATSIGGTYNFTFLNQNGQTAAQAQGAASYINGSDAGAGAVLVAPKGPFHGS